MNKLNSSGYMDPTAYEALSRIEAEEKAQARFEKFLDTIFKICELSGFHIENRIIVKDLRTGKVFK